MIRFTKLYIYPFSFIFIESEYIPDDALSIDLNSFDDNLIFEAYESTSDSDNSEYQYEIESLFIKPKRQFQVNADNKEDDNEFLKDEDVYKNPTSKRDLIKAIEESIVMPDISEFAPIEFPTEIEDGPSYEEGKYICIYIYMYFF